MYAVAGKQADRQTDRQTGRQAGRQTDRSCDIPIISSKERKETNVIALKVSAK